MMEKGLRDLIWSLKAAYFKESTILFNVPLDAIFFVAVSLIFFGLFTDLMVLFTMNGQTLLMHLVPSI